MSELYYIDILKKLVDRKQPIKHDELCCTRLSYEAFLADMEFLKSNGLVEEFTENNKVYYRATDSGIDYVDDLIRIKKYRENAR
jgi:predicted transcriptional regulator